jgi:hypothetical protein
MVTLTLSIPSLSGPMVTLELSVIASCSLLPRTSNLISWLVVLVDGHNGTIRFLFICTTADGFVSTVGSSYRLLFRMATMALSASLPLPVMFLAPVDQQPDLFRNVVCVGANGHSGSVGLLSSMLPPSAVVAGLFFLSLVGLFPYLSIVCSGINRCCCQASCWLY